MQQVKTTKNNTVIEIKQMLSDRESRGLSDNRFSIEYLNRSRSYFSVMKHQNKDISASALLALYGNLKSISNTWKEIADMSQHTADKRSVQNHIFFLELSEIVWGELRSRVAC